MPDSTSPSSIGRRGAEAHLSVVDTLYLTDRFWRLDTRCHIKVK